MRTRGEASVASTSDVLQSPHVATHPGIATMTCSPVLGGESGQPVRNRLSKAAAVQKEV